MLSDRWSNSTWIMLIVTRKSSRTEDEYLRSISRLSCSSVAFLAWLEPVERGVKVHFPIRVTPA